MPAFAFPAAAGTHLPTPERPWYEVAQAEIRTPNLSIANPALYHTATSAPIHDELVCLTCTVRSTQTAQTFANEAGPANFSQLHLSSSGKIPFSNSRIRIANQHQNRIGLLAMRQPLSKIVLQIVDNILSYRQNSYIAPVSQYIEIPRRNS